MSTNKRRKVDGPETPQSAVSAIAARRRLRGTTPSSGESSAADDSNPNAKPGNAFSVLQALKGSSSAIARTQDVKPAASPKRGPIHRQKSDTDSPAGSSTPRIANYTSFRLDKQNSRTKADGTVELRLSEGERFLVLGTYGLKVVSGTVTVWGATLTASDKIHSIQAPMCHGVPVIRTLERSQLQLTTSPQNSIRCLSSLSPLYRGIWNEHDEATNTKPSTFQILFTQDDAPRRYPVQELSSPAEWNKKLVSLTESIIDAQHGNDSVLVCGPKSAGKSTFSKLLTNRLLTSASKKRQISGIAVLDLDPGQPEYTPAGTLSLVQVSAPNFGAPFVHPGLHDASYRVVRCHAMASPSPASSPELFLQAASDLFSTYKSTMRGCPLIINTPGWILGTGLDLLSELITRIIPNEVVYMSHDGPLESVEAIQGATRRSFSTLPSQPSEVSLRTAAHLRSMQTMSYFHRDTDTQSWHAKPLASLRPWNIRYAGANPGIRGILSYDFQSPPDLLADAINGMILAAVVVEDKAAFKSITAGNRENTLRKSTEPAVAWSPEGLPILANPADAALDPAHSRMLGLVLVRGIDVSNQQLQIITPIPVAEVERAREQGHSVVLVHGKFDPPTWAYMEGVYEKSKALLPSVDNSASDAESDRDIEETNGDQEDMDMPWVEVLRGNQKRPVGSKAWRVRRDLGRNAAD